MPWGHILVLLTKLMRCGVSGDDDVTVEPLAQSEFLLYQTEDGRTRIQCRLENETLWLTQAQLAELFQTTVPNINLHL